MSNFIYVDGVSLQVKRAAISANTVGNTTIVAAVAAKKIRVVAMTFVVAADVAVAWESAGTSTIVPAMSFAAKGGMDVSRMPNGFICETVAGELLNIDLSAAVQVSGFLNYVEV